MKITMKLSTFVRMMVSFGVFMMPLSLIEIFMGSGKNSAGAMLVVMFLGICMSGIGIGIGVAYLSWKDLKDEVLLRPATAVWCAIALILGIMAGLGNR